MPFDRPTQSTCIDRVRGDIEGDLVGTDAYLPGSFERNAGNAVGKASHMMHGHLAHTARQLDPRKADEDVLVPQAAAHGVNRLVPVAAQVVIRVLGTNTTPVPAGTVWTRSDGRRYVSTTDHEIGEDVSGRVDITVTDEVTGSAGNLTVGATVRLATTITGVTAAAIVQSIVTQGSDLETLPRLADRYIQRLSNPPKGGANGDYVRWALEVPGVTRAWEFPHQLGVGTVSLYFVCDDEVDIIPDSTKIDEVIAYIDAPGRRPVTCELHVLAPVAVVLNMTIQLEPNTTAVRNAVTAEVKAYIRQEAAPDGTTTLLSRLDEAISVANGESDHVLVSPTADVVLPIGSLVVLGTIAFQDMP